MGNHPVELRAVVVHQAHVFGDHVVHFPFVADQMDLVVDRVFRSLGCDDLAADVGSKIVTAKGAEYSINYKVHLVSNEWKVYDVVAENVSLVNNYRSQFNRVISHSSSEDLLSG